jgi:hypothetical protein
MRGERRDDRAGRLPGFEEGNYAMKEGCTCKKPAEFDDHHEIDCDLTPDLTRWRYFSADRELEVGAVFVNHLDLSTICLRVGARYVVIAHEGDDEFEPEKTPSSELVEAHKAMTKAHDHVFKAGNLHEALGETPLAAEIGKTGRAIGRSLAGAREKLMEMGKLLDAEAAMFAERNSENEAV